MRLTLRVPAGLSAPVRREHGCRWLRLTAQPVVPRLATQSLRLQCPISTDTLPSPTPLSDPPPEALRPVALPVVLPAATCQHNAGPGVASHGPRPVTGCWAATPLCAWGCWCCSSGLAFLAKYAMDNAHAAARVAPGRHRDWRALRLFVLVAAPQGAKSPWGGPVSDLFPRQARRLAYALTLQGAGVAVLYLTVFAAFQALPVPAGRVRPLGCWALVCAFSTAIALLQNAMPMAFIGFAGAPLRRPFCSPPGRVTTVGLFSYYLLLGAAIVSGGQDARPGAR
jgi:hypothetical protein